MKNLLITGFVLLLGSLPGCKLDSPSGLDPEEKLDLPSSVNLLAENVSLRYTPFSTRSQVRAYLRSKNDVGVAITNYEVQYSFNGTTFLASLARLSNPTNVDLVTKNGFRTLIYFVIGSQEVIDAKGDNDRVYVRISISGKDVLGRAISYEFETTWII